MNRNRALAGGLALAGGVALASAVRGRIRQWSVNTDPTAGKALDDLADLSPTVERLFIDDDTALHVMSAGPAHGDLFVFAHCWTGDSRMWGQVARRLVEAGNRVVLYDHRGHGRSDSGASPADLQVLAADLADVLEHVDARDAVLVGHSIGGMTVQQLAADHRWPAKRVKAVVLVATACQLKLAPGLARFGPRFVGANRRSRVPALEAVLGPLGARAFFGSDPVLSHMSAASAAFLASHPATRAQLLDSMISMRLAGALSDIEVPVTVVAGERDLVTPVACSRQIVDSCPGAELVVIPQAGHMLPMERPDRLTELLLAVAERPVSSRHPERKPA